MKHTQYRKEELKPKNLQKQINKNRRKPMKTRNVQIKTGPLSRNSNSYSFLPLFYNKPDETNKFMLQFDENQRKLIKYQNKFENDDDFS